MILVVFGYLFQLKDKSDNDNEDDKNNINPLSVNPQKWSNTLKQTNCFIPFYHFVGLALKGL